MEMIERSHPTGMGGVQKLYRFDNGFGASVVRFRGSYGFEKGLWELGVIKFESEAGFDNFHLTYDTPITDDVLGYLKWSGVERLLKRIGNLKGRA